ncbi:carboxypeptidase-like regulatory domain-containing protein, partial [Xanthocytophaga flava]
MTKSLHRKPIRWMWLLTIFFLLTLPVFAQQTITGDVTNVTDNTALPGVTVSVKGTTNGTTTDTNGHYSIKVNDPNATLVFSFIGYVTEEVAIGGRTTVSISLAPDIQSLGEVVVTALGIEKDKKALVYSVSEAKGSEFTQAREN